MTSYYGKRIVAHDTDIGFSTGPATNNQRATIFGKMPENGWATAYGIWGGRLTGTNVTLSLCHWSVLSGAPHSLRARSSSFAVSTAMVDQNGGASFTSNITWSDLANYPVLTSAMLFKDTQYAVGFLSTGAQFSHAQNADGTVMYIGTVASQPPGAFVAGTSNPEGQIDVWIVYTPNTAPTVPTGLAPTGTGVTTLTPTFNANFVDSESSIGDQMNQYTIQLRAVGTTTLLWNKPYSATSAEIAAKQVQIPYGGTALTAGVAYEWRVMTFDMFGSGSPWTAWTGFTVNAGGQVNIANGATPTGKQLAVNGYTFQGQWTHGSSLAMKKLTVDILQNNAVVQTATLSVNIASSAFPGTNFTTTFAALGFSDLSWGPSYQWRMKGQDSGLIDSPYSVLTSFSADGYPNTPTALFPQNNTPYSQPPKLTANGTDPDDTPTALGGNLTETAKIYGLQTILNPGFATDATGWTGSNTGDTAGATATLAQESVVFPAGSGKVAVTASTAPTTAFVYHIENTATWIPAVVGESYTVRGTVQTDTTNFHPRLQIRWYDSSHTLLSVSSESDWTPNINTAYARSFTAVAPSNTTHFRIGAVLRTAIINATGNCYFNAFSYDIAVRVKPAMTYNVSTSLWEYQTLSGTDDVQTVSFGGTPSGGNWSLSFNGASSGNILWNASAATVQTALQAMPTFGSGNVLVTGGPGPASYVLTFASALRGTYQNAATVANVNLTGAAPTVAIAHTTPGVSTGLSVYGTFAWSCAGFDGTLQGAYASAVHFVYQPGPTVVMTAPTGTITTSTPTITWTATGQVKYQIIVKRASDNITVWDSGLVISGVQSVALPAGKLVNNGVYLFQVFVTDGTPLTGPNPPNTVTLTYSAPPTLAMTASTYSFDSDDQDSAVLLSWPLSSVVPSTFAYYIVDRRLSGDDVANAVILQYITNINQTSYIDDKPASNTPYTYSLRQVVTSGSDYIESGRSEDSATVTFNNFIISLASDGSSQRAVLKYATAQKITHTRDQNKLFLWGDSNPYIQQSPVNYTEPNGTFKLVTNSQQTAADMVTALNSLWDTGQVCCWRDNRGRRTFGLLSQFEENDDELLNYTVTLTISRVTFLEGQ